MNNLVFVYLFFLVYLLFIICKFPLYSNSSQKCLVLSVFAMDGVPRVTFLCAYCVFSAVISCVTCRSYVDIVFWDICWHSFNLVTRAFTTAYQKFIYFISPKTQFFILFINFYNKFHVSFFILQYILLKYYKIIIIFSFLFFPLSQSHLMLVHKIKHAPHLNPPLSP